MKTWSILDDDVLVYLGTCRQRGGGLSIEKNTFIFAVPFVVLNKKR